MSSLMGQSLPFNLQEVGGGPGCLVGASSEVIVLSATTPSGTASVLLSVPNQLRLVGETLFSTWLIADPAAPGASAGIRP